MERWVHEAAPLLGCTFFAVLFLQSGLDKVFDRAGNLAWMTPHFEKSPFRGRVPIFLTMLTLLELASGLACLGGLMALLIGPYRHLAKLALILACFNLICLFAGQRLAKDYAGAASLAAYFAAALVAVAACT